MSKLEYVDEHTIPRLRAHIRALLRENAIRKDEVQALQRALQTAKKTNPPFAYWMLDDDGEIVDLQDQKLIAGLSDYS